MTPTLFLHQHPFASFCWKPLIALHELELPFEPLLADADGRARLAALWPIARIPVLEDTDAGVTVFGSSACVEHADALAGGRLLSPATASRSPTAPPSPRSSTPASCTPGASSACPPSRAATARSCGAPRPPA
jgi:hypothetical protein